MDPSELFQHQRRFYFQKFEFEVHQSYERLDCALRSCEVSLHFFVTGVVNHLVDCIFENIRRAFTINTKITKLAMESMIGKPSLEPAIPTNAPMEENASER